jgi:16S rRNA (cytosine1402-N4)-methyltransferase
MKEFEHTSVLLRETIDGLRIKPEGIYVDGTLGGGGHALEVCRRLSGQGRLIGIDQDGEAIKAAQDRLKEFKDRVTILRSNYCAMKEGSAGNRHRKGRRNPAGSGSVVSSAR